MGKALLILSFLACLASCRGASQSTELKEEVRSEKFAIHCEKAAAQSETAATYRALMEVAGAQDCADAASKLRDMTFLVLNEKNLRDLAPLSDLEHIQWLHLYGNAIENLRPLKNLSQLKGLVLDNNQITDISPLSGLINIQELHLGRNKIENIQGLSSLSKLYILNLASNQIKDVRPLRDLLSLMVLNLKNNPVSDRRTSDMCPVTEGTSQVVRDFCSQ